jgi:hypothetical protein
MQFRHDEGETLVVTHLHVSGIKLLTHVIWTEER